VAGDLERLLKAGNQASVARERGALRADYGQGEEMQVIALQTRQQSGTHKG
jgi:hypothetical protein